MSTESKKLNCVNIARADDPNLIVVTWLTFAEFSVESCRAETGEVAEEIHARSLVAVYLLAVVGVYFAVHSLVSMDTVASEVVIAIDAHTVHAMHVRTLIDVDCKHDDVTHPSDQHVHARVRATHCRSIVPRSRHGSGTHNCRQC